jgi:hypothetical protein
MFFDLPVFVFFITLNFGCPTGKILLDIRLFVRNKSVVLISSITLRQFNLPSESSYKCSKSSLTVSFPT